MPHTHTDKVRILLQQLTTIYVHIYRYNILSSQLEIKCSKTHHRTQTSSVVVPGDFFFPYLDYRRIWKGHHSAFIVSLWTGRNVSIKIMSIEWTLFSFHLQITTCFHEVSCFPCGIDVFNAATVPWYSGGVQLSKGRGWSEEKDWENEEGAGREKGKTVISSFQRCSGPTELFLQGCRVSRCQGEVSAL